MESVPTFGFSWPGRRGGGGGGGGALLSGSRYFCLFLTVDGYCRFGRLTADG